jgi:hypothetical protein
MRGFFSSALIGPLGVESRGYQRVRRDQIQTTFQKALSPRLIKADTGSFIAELGYTRLGDLPAAVPLNPVTRNAWGYVVSWSATYNRALFDLVNLTPTVSFRHDVHGVAGPFIEEAKALTVGVNVDYMIKWFGTLSITRNFDGSGVKNNLTGAPVRADEDRNWLSVSVGYQF